jgi:hypothetical protein
VTKLTAARLALPAIIVLLFAGACSDSGGDASDDTSVGPSPSVLDTVPSSDGDECIDERGDLSSGAATAGAGSDPPGLDIVRGTALVDGSDLAVEIETGGSIETLLEPLFVVAQGDAGGQYSFELRAERGADENWKLTLITFSPDETRTSIPNPVTVEGSVVSFSVPLSALPPIGLYMAFGAAAEVPGVGTVIDDCNSLDAPPATG